MTTDSPKGPESEARPDLRAQIAQALDTAYEGIDPDNWLRSAPASDAVMAIVAPELGRLTAEVERLREQRGLAEHAASMRLDLLQEVDRVLRPLLGDSAPDDEWFPDDLARYAAGLVAKERAEVSCLREQLATATGTLCELVALKDGPRDASYHERKPLAWREARDFLAGVPVSESVPATPEQGLTNESFISSQDEGRPADSGRLAPRSDEELLRRLRVLVADLQSPGTGTRGEAYDSGFLDGQIQAGNDLEALLDEYTPDAAQAARSEATSKQWRDIRGCEWEEVAPHDELRLIRTDPSHCREIDGPTFSRRYVEAHYGPLVELTPSPSLPQEGGTDG